MAEFKISIIAGKYKGKKLQSPSLDSTRSTKSIVKGSLFDTLHHNVIDQIFIEVFAGSGSIGLEAISRGAKNTYFIEKDLHAFKILNNNCFNISKNQTETFLGDSFEIYPKIIDNLEKHHKKAYIYFDPPFDIREGMKNIYEKVYSLIKKTPKSVVLEIIIEHASTVSIPEIIGSYTLKKTKKFGKTSLSYLK